MNLVQEVFVNADSPFPELSHSDTTGKPRSWREVLSSVSPDDKKGQTGRHPAAAIIQEDDRKLLRKINPLRSDLDYRLCKKCSRPFLTQALGNHLQECSGLSEKVTGMAGAIASDAKADEKLQKNGKQALIDDDDDDDDDDEEEDDDSEVEVKKPAVRNSKRKSGASDYSQPTKKARKSASATALTSSEKVAKSGSVSGDKKPAARARKQKSAVSKAKGPVDVEKQCGVPLPAGGLCARSLTCKTHSMGAKRAVFGRSAPYDILLANYQKRNQVKLASMSTAQQLADENEAEADSVPLSPEEEFQAVLEGVRKARPIPLERNILIPTPIKKAFINMREMFASALTPRGAATGPLMGRALLMDSWNGGLHFRPSASMQRAKQITMLQKHRMAEMQRQQQAQQSQSTKPMPTKS